MVRRHEISDIDRLTCTRANRLLESAKRGHIEPSDRSAVIQRLLMVIKAKDACVEFRLDKFDVQMIAAMLSLYVRVKIG